MLTRIWGRSRKQAFRWRGGDWCCCKPVLRFVTSPILPFNPIFSTIVPKFHNNYILRLSSIIRSYAMYSATGFLGANGQQAGQYQQQQPQQQQQTGFPGQQSMVPQPTGFMGYQQTGFPGQQTQQQQQLQQQQQFQQQQPLQQQFTGFPTGLQGFSSQQGIPPVPPLPNLQTFSPQPQQQQQQQQQAPPPQSSTPKNLVKIPNIRLSFVTVADQAKFEQLFKAAVGDGQALPGKISVY